MKKLSKRQITALKKSIKHWENMRDRPELGEKPTGKECACCQEWVNFEKILDDIDCFGCPIFEYTKKKDCYGTPYNDAKYAFFVKGPQSSEFKAEATEMINLMETILQEGE